jgi:AcrR family transcriptional regulator
MPGSTRTDPAARPFPEGEAGRPLRADAERKLRADAERNRRRILDAAARIYARSGLSASFDEIAREAQVGVGTVYRRFPTEEDLFFALFEERLEGLLQQAQRAVQTPDAGAALLGFLEAMVQQHVEDRGLKDLVFSRFDCTERMTGARHRFEPVMAQLVERAKQQGVLRPDVGQGDIAMAIFMVTSAGALSAETDPQQWRRQLALVWQGLCCHPDDHEESRTGRLPSQPLTTDQVATVFNQGRPRARPPRTSPGG